MPDNPRKLDHPASQIFIERFSPRSFTGETIPDATLATFFEAARWSPSSYNSQPWRFLYAKKESPDFAKFLNLLGEGNQPWCAEASVLLFICSKKTMKLPNKDEEVPSRTHSFDAGSAWMAFALQASMSGWHAHGMVGLDYDRATAELHVPGDHQIEAAIALGKLGSPEKLPERYRAMETPNARKPITETTMAGGFKA